MMSDRWGKIKSAIETAARNEEQSEQLAVTWSIGNHGVDRSSTNYACQTDCPRPRLSYGTIPRSSLFKRRPRHMHATWPAPLAYQRTHTSCWLQTSILQFADQFQCGCHFLSVRKSIIIIVRMQRSMFIIWDAERNLTNYCTKPLNVGQVSRHFGSPLWFCCCHAFYLLIINSVTKFYRHTSHIDRRYFIQAVDGPADNNQQCYLLKQ